MNTKLQPIKFEYRKNGRDWWSFKCECGNSKITTWNKYQSKNTKSCGCLIQETLYNRGKNRVGERFSSPSLVATIMNEYEEHGKIIVDNIQ